MFKKMKLSAKLALGFSIVIVALCIVGLVSYSNISSLSVSVYDLDQVHIPLVESISKIDVSLTGQELAINKYLIHKDKIELEAYHELNKAVDNSLSEAKKIINSDEDLVAMNWIPKIDAIAEKHDFFVAACAKLIKAVENNAPFEELDPLADNVSTTAASVMTNVDAFLGENKTEIHGVSKDAETSATMGITYISTVAIGAIILGIIAAYLIIRSTNKSLTVIINNLLEGAEQVASASEQVANAGQSLAAGASEQAASLEETSSALEEMSSMTRQNADNANTANNLSVNARQAAEEGNSAMANMLTAMTEINDSSNEISKIIKVIEEIAFQTNLLALNAAVEAARAGDAGKGFAVVADEVRNLAQRAATAAKDTTVLIENSVNRAAKGQEIAEEAGNSLNNIVENVKKAADLVAEISASSQEQAQGIDQVSIAITQMDKVTQQNAANAEESASAAEELSAQSIAVKSMVDDLLEIVEGANKAHNVNNGIEYAKQKQKGLQLVSNHNKKHNPNNFDLREDFAGF